MTQSLERDAPAGTITGVDRVAVAEAESVLVTIVTAENGGGVVAQYDVMPIGNALVVAAPTAADAGKVREPTCDGTQRICSSPGWIALGGWPKMYRRETRPTSCSRRPPFSEMPETRRSTFMTESRPNITIGGEKVALGLMRRDLVPLYHTWITNLETTQYLSEAGAAPTLDEEIAWFEQLARNASTRTFTIYTLPAYVPIGTVNLHQIDFRHRKANMGIMIGEPDMRGRGLGTEAVELIVDYAFNALDLHSVWLTTYEFNLAGRAAYARAGFREVGRRRQSRYHAGRYWDEIHMDILAPEFTKSRLVGRLVAHATPAKADPNPDGE